MQVLDETNMTAEQKFILMLDERLSQVEDDVVKFHHMFIGKKKELPENVTNAINYYQNVFNKRIKTINHDMIKPCKENFPETLHNLIDAGNVEYFDKIVYYSKNNIESSYVYFSIYRLYEVLGDRTTPELIEWIDKQFKEQAEKI